MSNNITYKFIKNLTEEDAEKFWDKNKKLFSQLSKLTFKWGEMKRALMVLNTPFIWVAYKNSIPIGWATIFRCGLCGVYVKRNCRKDGIGTNLASKIIRYSRRYGVNVYAEPWTVSGYLMYSKTGFNEDQIDICSMQTGELKKAKRILRK